MRMNLGVVFFSPLITPNGYPPKFKKRKNLHLHDNRGEDY